MMIPLSYLELIVRMRQDAYSNQREKGEKKEMNKKEKTMRNDVLAWKVISSFPWHVRL